MKKLSDDKITGLFNVIDQKLTAQSEKLDAIHEQTKLTNGRVTKLEGWRNRIEGGLKVVVLILVPVLLYYIYQFVHK